MGLFDFIFGINSDSSSSNSSDLLGDSDMTKDYIGRHGEFDRNDEERAICEDMFSMKVCDGVSDEDLTEHFGWENKLNYDSEGYSDEEGDGL